MFFPCELKSKAKHHGDAILEFLDYSAILNLESSFIAVSASDSDSFLQFLVLRKLFPSSVTNIENCFSYL